MSREAAGAGDISGGDGTGGDAPRGRPAWQGPATGSATGHVLVLVPALAGELARRGEAAYPREGCGVLLGRVDEQRGARVVTAVEAAENRWEGRDDRYLVDPGTLRRLLEAEERGGPRVLGFWHSHPDAPPRPSATDRELAWPWYHYVIVPVEAGTAGTPRAWEVDGPEGPFVERRLRVGGGGDGGDEPGDAARSDGRPGGDAPLKADARAPADGAGANEAAREV